MSSTGCVCEWAWGGDKFSCPTCFFYVIFLIPIYISVILLKGCNLYSIPLTPSIYFHVRPDQYPPLNIDMFWLILVLVRSPIRGRLSMADNGTSALAQTHNPATFVNKNTNIKANTRARALTTFIRFLNLKR